MFLILENWWEISGRIDWHDNVNSQLPPGLFLLKLNKKNRKQSRGGAVHLDFFYLKCLLQDQQSKVQVVNKWIKVKEPGNK